MFNIVYKYQNLGFSLDWNQLYYYFMKISRTYYKIVKNINNIFKNDLLKFKFIEERLSGINSFVFNKTHLLQNIYIIIKLYI